MAHDHRKMMVKHAKISIVFEDVETTEGVGARIYAEGIPELHEGDHPSPATVAALYSLEMLERSGMLAPAGEHPKLILPTEKH